MKPHILIGMISILCLAAGTAPAQEATGLADKGPEHHLQYLPGDIKWPTAPASLEQGAQVAILEGNPAEAGIFTMRIRMPDGFRIAPHWHPNVERVTVLAGRFHIGTGDRVDRENTEPLEPGGPTPSCRRGCAISSSSRARRSCS